MKIGNRTINFKKANQVEKSTGKEFLPAGEKAVLSFRALIWRRFRKSKIGMLGLIMVGIIYLGVLPAEFISPYNLDTQFDELRYAPPQRLRLVDAEGRFSLRPFVYPVIVERDPTTLRLISRLDTSRKFYLRFFVRGDEYKVLLFKSNLHLFGVDEGYIFLLGTDVLGQDLFTRILYGGRVSMTVGLLGVAITLILGSFMGVLSGYFGGVIDNIMQRGIELLLSIPSLPLWAGLSAAVPAEWDPILVFFMVTIILSLTRWGGLAREVRGLTLSLREREFVLAGKMAGAKTGWVIRHHVLPNCTSHIIVRATLAIPGFILGETSLSFLGLGIRPPMTSWGVLLQEAQRISVMAHHVWLMIPVFLVIISILGWNFLGDGIRDAVDPFARK